MPGIVLVRVGDILPSMSTLVCLILQIDYHYVNSRLQAS